MLAAKKNLITNYILFVNSSMMEVPIIQKLVHSFAEKINGLVGFFMIETSVMKGLNQHIFFNSSNKKAMINF